MVMDTNPRPFGTPTLKRGQLEFRRSPVFQGLAGTAPIGNKKQLMLEIPEEWEYTRNYEKEKF